MASTLSNDEEIPSMEIRFKNMTKLTENTFDWIYHYSILLQTLKHMPNMINVVLLIFASGEYVSSECTDK